MNRDTPSIELITRFREGDERAAEELFRRYLGRLTVLARARLAPRIARRIDAEDVVLSAYRSFFLRTRDGRLHFEQSGDLWRVLVAITLNKLHRTVAHHQARRRSVTREHAGTPEKLELAGLWNPTEPIRPDEAVAIAELLESILLELEPQARTVLELRLQDYSIQEMATAIGRSERTVRRELQVIRTQLARHLPPEAGARMLLERDVEPAVPKVSDDRHHGDRLGVPGMETAHSNPTPDWPAIADSFGRKAEDLHSSEGLLATAAPIIGERSFVIQQHLGSGGIGRVYRAWMKDDRRTVAVKILRKGLQRDPGATHRFLREAETLSMLHHPGIVTLQGVGRMHQGSLFLVMDFIGGRNLAQVLADGPLSPAFAAFCVASVAEAVQYAHDWGVIHCDLKPANVLLDDTGKIHVADFGLAARLRAERPPHALGGTLGYMAPEQLDPEWGPIGPATDVFGLGAVLTALLTSHALAASTTVSGALQKILRGGHLKILDLRSTGIPLQLAEICRRCLAPVPRDRFSSATELAKALNAYLAADGIPPATSHRLDEKR